MGHTEILKVALTRWICDLMPMGVDAMRCSGVRDTKAKVMYYAVYKFGPHWPTPGVMGALSDIFRGSAPKTLATQPRKRATKADVRRIQAFVNAKNPTLPEIETDALRSSKQR